MYTQFRIKLSAYHVPDEGFYVSGYDLEGLDGPFDDWETLEIHALGNRAWPTLDEAYAHAAEAVKVSLLRARELYGVEQRLF